MLDAERNTFCNFLPLYQSVVDFYEYVNIAKMLCQSASFQSGCNNINHKVTFSSFCFHRVNVVVFKMFVLKTTLKNSKIYSGLTFKNASFSTAAAKIDGRFMIIDMKDDKNKTKNEQFKYSLLWLRDNCQCPSCFHTQTKSRIIDWSKFDLKNAQAKTVTVFIQNHF